MVGLSYGLFLCGQDVRKVRNQRYKNVPMCQKTCDNWWEACKFDLTCTDNWTQNFNWSSGKYVFSSRKGLGGSVCWSLGARLGESVWRAWVEVCEGLGESVWRAGWKCVKGLVEVCGGKKRLPFLVLTQLRNFPGQTSCKPLLSLGQYSEIPDKRPP